VRASSFRPSKRGGIREEVCTPRVEELSAELASLQARGSELAEEISESAECCSRFRGVRRCHPDRVKLRAMTS
jgi:hypothetical protein